MENLKDLLEKIYHKTFGRNNLFSLLRREIEDGWTILDVGCGHHSSLIGIKKGSLKVGLDHYEPYISKSRSQSVHDFYVLGDARELPFEANSFDCALATEVLEHLDKQEGSKMIKEMERVAKKKILLTTPNGFLPTYPGPNDNPDEAHLSGWTVDDVKDLGFKVYGISGLKALWKVESGQAVIRFKPRKVFGRLVEITELFVYYYPSLAFQLFLVKNIGEKSKENH